MQTLWTRVGQSHCLCRHLSTAALARPSTTAPVRRRLGLDDVFAAFFSTVAFASAVADGNRKTARKEEWVRVIKEAKRELHVLQADQERRISNLEHAGQPSPGTDEREIHNTQPQSWQDVLDG